MQIARGGEAEFELVYRYGSFLKQEFFPRLEDAVARARALWGTTPTHSFVICRRGETLLAGADILTPANGGRQ